jgi:hypothetical protein
MQCQVPENTGVPNILSDPAFIKRDKNKYWAGFDTLPFI